MKNLNNQSPTVKGRAVQNASKAVEHANTAWIPADPKTQIRIIRTKLFHSNGEFSHMVWHLPNYTAFIEAHIEAVDAMNEYINYLASTWVGIDKYQTEFGVLDSDGNFKKCPVPYVGAMETVIASGSTYVPGTKGKWIQNTKTRSADGGWHEEDLHLNKNSNIKKGGAGC
jgi:hypothetical protein